MSLTSAPKILDILTLFDEGHTEMTMAAISQATDIPQSSAYRYVRVLCDMGFLEKSTTGLYQLGYRFYKLSQVAVQSNRNLRLAALPSMRHIASLIDETITLMRLSDKYAICIESIEGQHAVRVVVEQGRLQPLYVGASSRVLLSALDEAEWDNYLPQTFEPLTPTTMTDRALYRQQLHETRARGYAISNGEIDEGGRAVAVPVRNLRNKVVAALSVEGPYFRMDDDTIAGYITLLREETAHIRAKLV